MLSQLRPAILLTLILTVITGIIYPTAVTGMCQLFFHRQAEGSLVIRNGLVTGSEWIAQNFTKPEYFHPRPSAAGSSGYDGAASGGSNLGPTNPDLMNRLRKDAAAYRTENQTTAAIPADAVTTSASGLDPEISPANAVLQSPRVATARGTSSEAVLQLVRANTANRQFGFLGEPRVNVLRLNLALDERFPVHQ